MRPEIIPHLLEFSVPTWKVLFYVASVGLGVYNGYLEYVKEGKNEAARGKAIWTAAGWGVGGILVTNFLLLPNMVIPDAEKHGGLYDLPLHTYGFALALGFMLAISISAREAERNGIFPGESPPRDDEQRAKARNAVLDLAFYVLIAALVGSRIYFIFVNWTGPDGYGAHPENILKFWTGGLVFYGGFLGSVAMSFYYARKHKLNFLRLADLAMPTVSLGQFFGRLGCFAAGCCYGKEVPPGQEWLGVKFPPGSLAWDSMVNQRHLLAPDSMHTPALYPSQLVDGFGQLCIFLALTYIAKPRRRFEGQILLTWLVLYPALRFSDEFLRGDSERGLYTSLQVSAGQLTSLALMLAALGLLVFLLRGREQPQAEAVAA